ncbi:hypothetical protein AURDEDRAFT_115781 [Auricularia subglabra TFB-10046 SS5]|nr:hypothetical protein AURDEDRAFT_115781 [Auricularia subglabra TFB-10046 SS5]
MFSWSDATASTLDTASPSSPQWSEPTSDEPADLGAFGSVFRALSTINTGAQRPHFRTFPAPTPTSSAATNTSPSVPSLSESDGDGGPADTVWAQRPIASYLSPVDSADQPSPSPPSVPSTPPPPPFDQDDDDDEDEEDDDDEANGTERQQFDDEGDEDELPSLGLFDSTLGFIAEERAKLAAERLASGLSAALDSQGVKRKRRRRRRGRGKDGDGEDGSPEYDTSTGDALSAPERSQPQTPRRRKQQQPPPSTITPIAPPPVNGAVSRPLPVPPSPAVQRLRSLAQKLRGMYPDDAPHLSRVLQDLREPAEPGGFVDVRGPPATPTDPVVHVFVDYSNILIGFISCIKRHPELYPRRGRDDKPRLSHEAMSLVFERGRPTAKRELAASKPLYQPMTTAYQLGFDVHLFQRVPHEESNSPASPSSPTKRRHGPQSSDSDFGRARWREQGVDECLQLKMYQSVVGPDAPGTIVLATGDAAPSQYNAMGFPGTVQSALDRGWSVELYAWENGLSAGWARTFGHHERFRIRGLEEFAEFLAAPYVPPHPAPTSVADPAANPFAA